MPTIAANMSAVTFSLVLARISAKRSSSSLICSVGFAKVGSETVPASDSGAGCGAFLREAS
jgi:hypothetical protein